ncbi:uncharacterized protein LOC127586112 [Pristis pectinata]|uniref:uncharacterized protein LOC127586112 n=1 Tax=Pristis pectinata TaxID=685728 RepID=UPI00223D7A98|nr:uncharacterized protein LOC127586112 [Pristis pectinata]
MSLLPLASIASPDELWVRPARPTSAGPDPPGSVPGRPEEQQQPRDGSRTPRGQRGPGPFPPLGLCLGAGSAIDTSPLLDDWLTEAVRWGWIGERTNGSSTSCIYLDSICIPSGCITAWYSNCSAQDRKKLQRVVDTAQRITDTSLPSLDSVFTSRCLGEAAGIIKDPTHPGHSLFSLLPSGRRYRSLRARTTRLKDSFYPTVIRLLNGSLIQ